MEIAIPSLNFLIIAPEIVVLVTAFLVMVVDLFLPRQQKSRLAWLSLVGVLMAAGLSYYTWDGSNATLHNMLAADGYALFLNLAVLTTAALAILFSVEYVERIGLARGEYYTLLLLSTTGMMLMSAAINLMIIFLALEIMSIALYVLVGLNRKDRRSGEAALKYLLLGAFASGFLLYGMALVYGQVGTTSLAGVHDYVMSLDGKLAPLLMVGLGLMLIGLGFKVALVPFQMWTPDVYHGAPTSVTAFMSVGAKTAGFAALGRVALYAFGDMYDAWVWLLAILAVLTMTVGNLIALRQTNLKRMLAYSGIAHAGYILVGVTAGNKMGIIAMLFYLFTYAFANTGAFAVIIAAGRLGGGDTQGEALDSLTGFAARSPWLAAAMTLFMLSLAGIPPLAGFLGKLYLFTAAVQADLTWLAASGVVNSVISAYYYLRVIATMYRKEDMPEDAPKPSICLALQLGVGMATMAVVLFGIWPGPILDLVQASILALLGG